MPYSKLFRRAASLLTISLIVILTISLLHRPLAYAAVWSAEAQIPTPTGEDKAPAIINLASGTQFLAWSTDKDGTPDIYFMTKSGASWSTPVKVEQGGLGTTYSDVYPTVVELSNGKVMIVWAQCDPSGSPCDMVYNTYSFSSPHWDLGFTVLASSGPVNSVPSVARASDGYVYVFWQSDRTGGTNAFDIYYSRSPNPDAEFPTWDPDTRMPYSTSLVDDLFPSAVPGKNGGLWLAWVSARDSRPGCEPRPVGQNDHEIYLSYLNLSWSPPVQLTTTNCPGTDPVGESTDTDPSLALTKDGGLWLVWDSDRESGTNDVTLNLYFKRSYDPLTSGSWSPDQRLTNAARNDFNVSPSAAEVAPGTIGVTWATNRLAVYDLFYATLSFHNLQVLTVQPNPTAVQPGGQITITVTSANRGAYTESVTLRIYANATQLTSSTTTRVPGETWNLIYTWSTTGWTPGRYQIRAEITQVSLEENVADNSLVGGPAIVALRDLSVASIVAPNCPTLSSCYIYRGQTINVNVEVANQGQVRESTTLTLRYNGTYIGETTVSMESGSATTATIPWDTTNVLPGIYRIEASVPSLQSEKDVADNSSSVLVKLRKTGDTDGDGDVDLDDLVGTFLSQFTVNARYDIDGDGDVDIDDLILVFISQFS
jgi:hypothetical protein